jgi:hypothetical protein
MFPSSGVRSHDRAGVVAVADCRHARAKKGSSMEFLVVAIVAILGFGLFRYLRTRSD